MSGTFNSAKLVREPFAPFQNDTPTILTMNGWAFFQAKLQQFIERYGNDTAKITAELKSKFSDVVYVSTCDDATLGWYVSITRDGPPANPTAADQARFRELEKGLASSLYPKNYKI